MEKKENKKILWLLLAVTVAAMAVFSSVRTVNAETNYTYLSVTAKAQSQKKVKLTWKNKGTGNYIVYRATYKKNGDHRKLKKIATVPAGKNSYTDKTAKKNTRYYYQVKTVSWKNGKKNVFWGSDSVYTGVDNCMWEEYHYAYGKYSTTEIQLAVYVGNGLKPDGFEVFRAAASDPTESYKKIAAVKKKAWSFTYTDKSVTAGEAYLYKLCAYKKINGKKYFSVMSDAMWRSAVNQSGIYKAEIAYSADRTLADVCLTADKDNGILQIREESLYHTGWTEDEKTGRGYLAEAYSMDGVNWTDVKNEDGQVLKVQPGESIYVRFAAGTEVDAEKPEEWQVYVTYNNIWSSILSVNMKELNGCTYPDDEGWH